jgi:hypothetical protein
MGLKDETGAWHYPYSLHLGQLTQNQSYVFNFWLSVPVACQLESAITGVHLKPTCLEAGLQEIYLYVDPLRQDTALYGYLYLQSAQIKRRIQLTAHTIPGDTMLEIVSSPPLLLWTPSFWQPPAQKSVTKETTSALKSAQISKPDKITPAQSFEVSKPTATPPIDAKTHLERLENSVFFTEAAKKHKTNNQGEQPVQPAAENVFLKSDGKSR